MWVALLIACAEAVDEDAPPAVGFVAVEAGAANLEACLSAFPESPAHALGEAWQAAPCAGVRSATWNEEGPGDFVCAAPSAEIEAWRRHAVVAFATPPSAAGQLAGRITALTTGGFHVEVRAPAPDSGSPLRLLVPADEGRATPLLSNKEAAFRVRMQTEDGIDIAAMIPPGSQGAELFGLKSALLSGAVLDGSWELGVYPPEAGAVMPRMVLGLGVRALTADSALDSFMEQLRAQWSVRRAPITTPGWKGECVSGLKLMPDFEPCYLRKDDILVIGWNRSSAEHGAADEGRPAQSPNGLSVDFAVLEKADAALAEGADSRWLVPAIRYPLGRIDLALRRNGEHQLVLEGDTALGCER